MCFQQRRGSRFYVCLKLKTHNACIMNTITFKTLGRATRPARRRHNQVVILRSLDLAHRYSPFAQRRRSDVRRLTASVLRRTLRAVFSDTGVLVATAAVLAIAAYHSIVITDAVEAQAAVGIDVLALMPWAIVFAIRHNSDRPADEEGGAR